MGAKVHELALPGGEHYSWVFCCPACKSKHQCDNRWVFNGDVEQPTFDGSLLVHAVQHGTPDQPIHRPRCHSQITDGRIHYYSDSEHALAGHTVDLPDWKPELWTAHESVSASSRAGSERPPPLHSPPLRSSPTDTPMSVEVFRLDGVTVRHPSK